MAWFIARSMENCCFRSVPSFMDNTIIAACHREVGHQGLNKTMEYVNQIYWFPFMKKKASNKLNTCLKCITFKNIKNRTEGRLHGIDKDNIPVHTLHVDYYRPNELSEPITTNT